MAGKAEAKALGVSPTGKVKKKNKKNKKLGRPPKDENKSRSGVDPRDRQIKGFNRGEEDKGTDGSRGSRR